mmetsp:Transcript_41440/g.137807  ORF Transcript_41440/g.137807 Transcript_41440/m.137807 type:complete len:211 (+) Transcript_41440:677-1309(+)
MCRGRKTPRSPLARSSKVCSPRTRAGASRTRRCSTTPSSAALASSGRQPWCRTTRSRCAPTFPAPSSLSCRSDAAMRRARPRAGPTPRRLRVPMGGVLCERLSRPASSMRHSRLLPVAVQAASAVPRRRSRRARGLGRGRGTRRRRRLGACSTRSARLAAPQRSGCSGGSSPSPPRLTAPRPSGRTVSDGGLSRRRCRAGCRAWTGRRRT